MSNQISNQDNTIDSRDVIKRIEELETRRDMIKEEFDSDPMNEGVDFLNVLRNHPDFSSEEVDELLTLKALAEEAEDTPDWEYGEVLVRKSYFTKYIEELIDDCYEMPKEFKSGSWPFRHMQIDYEAAADEAKADYIEVDFDGVTYLIRSC